MKVIVDNDETKNAALPAVIIANVRSGGTFLSHCLSNHPQIFCDRGESLHHLSLWHTYLTVDRVKLLYCLTHMSGWRASLCKLTYNNAFQPDLWAYLDKARPHVIHLSRRNVIRQAVSALINRMARAGQIEHPSHSFETPAAARVDLAPQTILDLARGLRAEDERVAKALAGWPHVLALDYATLMGGEGMVASRLDVKAGRAVCDFLGVTYHAMPCELKRVNPQPLSEILTNWQDVLPAIQASEFAECLGDEAQPGARRRKTKR